MEENLAVDSSVCGVHGGVYDASCNRSVDSLNSCSWLASWLYVGLRKEELGASCWLSMCLCMSMDVWVLAYSSGGRKVGRWTDDASSMSPLHIDGRSGGMETDRRVTCSTICAYAHACIHAEVS